MQTTFAFLAIAAVAFALPAELTDRAAQVTHNGDATYYTQDGVAGSCGQYHSDNDYIVALGNAWMQSGTNYCGRKIQVTNMGGGQSNNGKGKVITVTVADTCEGCDSNHIDFAEGPFKGLTGGNLDPPGEFQISWHFCNVNGQC